MDNRAQLLNDPEEALRIALDGRLSSVWTAGPGIVTAVDLATMTLSVQPAIKGTITDENNIEQSVNLPLLIHVPIVFPSAGGFSMTFPVKVNDEVLIVWACRCIDAWWQSGGVQRPIEARLHDLSDGFAIPGIKSIPKVIPNISATGAQLRNDAGTTYVEIAADGKIKLVSPAGIAITGNVIVTGEVTANGIPLSTHKHTGVTVGGGTSLGPVP